MTLQEKRKMLMKEYGTDFMPDDEKGIDFYYRCKKAGLDLINADEYAVLNTLLGYDVGLSASAQINYWLWEHDIETLELGCDNKSKKLIRQAAKERGIKLDFSKWLSKPYETYSYF